MSPNRSTSRRQERRHADVYPHPLRREGDVEVDTAVKNGGPAPRRTKADAKQSSPAHDRPAPKKAKRPTRKSAVTRRVAAKKPEPAAPQPAERLYLRGTNLQPPGHRLIPCQVGSKQSILVDTLRRKEGATMAELLEALSGGRRPWQEATVRAGFGWSMKLKGYGVRSEFDQDGTERFFLVVPKGQRIPKHSPTRVFKKNL